MMQWGRVVRRLAAAAFAVALSGGAGRAQGIDCEELRQQMAAVTRPDPNRQARFDRAIQQQRAELARAQGYADSIGCGGIHVFDSAPAQCGGLERRIARMQANLDSLENQAHALRNGDPDQAQDLAARYDAYCRTVPGQDDAAIYSDPGTTDGMPVEEQGSTQAQGGDKAICVRTCDGGYFPLASGVANDAIGGLQSLCSAQCPNTEAKLYTTRDTDNIAEAQAVDGSSYSELPNAFKFTKTHDASCTCKPPNKTWVEALAGAEELLEKQGHDVTVTEKMSAEMARPSQPAPAPAKKPGKRDRKAIVLPLPPPVPADAALGALASEAPAAGAGAAGPGPATARTDDGAVRTVPDPAGAGRRVRTIAPGL